MTTAYLLDTHALLWTLADDKRLSRSARRAILKDEARLVVSVVSAWEIILKHQAGKLKLDVGLQDMLDVVLRGGHWSVLPITAAHVAALAELPALHRDPFDRLLVAQARTEGLTILTADKAIREYPVPTLW